MMSDRRLLFVAPASIPVNGAEAIVNVKLLKLLVSKGYKIDLISKKAKWEHYPLMQEEELQRSLSSVTVIEIENRLSIRTIWYHIMAWFRFGVVFKGAYWAFIASNTVKKLVRSNHYLCVITKNIPSELVGYWAKVRYGIPWAATWNDPYPRERFPEPYSKGPHTRLWLLKRPLIKKMRMADAHIFPSARLRDYMQGYLKCDAGKTYIIPHIVEPLRRMDVQSDGVLKICYIGCLNEVRQPWTTIEALDAFHKKNCAFNFKVDFIGTTASGTKEEIKSRGLEDIVRVFPPVSYSESLDLLQKYDLALIIEAPCPEGVFLPSKVSDAMAAGLSVFAISPAVGVLHDLFENGYIHYFSDVTRLESIVEGLDAIASDFLAGRLGRTAVPTDFLPEYVGNQYERIFQVIG